MNALLRTIAAILLSACVFSACSEQPKPKQNLPKQKLPTAAAPLPDDTVSLILTLNPPNSSATFTDLVTGDLAVFRNTDFQFYIFPKYSIYASDGTKTVLLQTYESELSGSIGPPYTMLKMNYSVRPPFTGSFFMYATLEHSDTVYRSHTSNRGDSSINFPPWRGKATSNNVNLIIK